MQIRSSFLSTDVTALHIVNDKLIAGIGGAAQVYDLSSGSALLERRVFEGQKVHGFALQDERLLVHGGRLLAVLTWPALDVLNKVAEAPDWIKTALWLQEGLALALAHNVVCWWRDGACAGRVACQETCILYSALLLGTRWADLLVLSGTVFSEVLVWKIQDSATSPVWHRLQGHKGVIFSVAFDAATQRVLTSSDDRSVRVWQVAKRWAQVCCVHVLHRHTARVWRALPSRLGLVSIGEDSLLCQWDFSGELLWERSVHQGGNVVCLAVSENRIVTGGGDGGIAAWSVGRCPATHSLRAVSRDDGVRRVCVSARGRVVAVTEAGCLFWQELASEDQEWTLLAEDVRFRRYALLHASPCQTLFAVASITGDLAVYSETVDGFALHSTTQVAPRKVLALLWLTSELLLTAEVGGVRKMWCLESAGLVLLGQFRSPGKDRGVTAALLVDEWLVFGDQVGSVSVLDTKNLIVTCTLPRLVAGDGVTCLHYDDLNIHAAGKGGHMYLLRLDRATGRLTCLRASKTQLGWIVGLRTTTSSLLGLSFHRENFCVHDFRRQTELLGVHCGGGHRSWDLLLLPEHLTFVYVQERCVWRVTTRLSYLAGPELRPGLHWRMVNCALPLSGDALVTAGDEGLLRLSVAGRQHCVLGGHLSSVRALCRVKQRYLISGGGRAQLIVWQLHRENNEWAAEQLCSHMLCAEDAGRSRTPWCDATFTPKVDPETRYMDLAELPCHDVLAACSDATVRILRLDEAAATLCVTATLHLHRVCVLRVASLDTLLLSACCDGELKAWDRSGTPAWRAAKLHGGGLNALAVSAAQDHVLVASGGDDNRVTLSKVQQGLSTVWSSSQGHAAQVSGVAILSPDVLLTAGKDQRVVVWEKGEPRTCVTSLVADVQGLATWNLTDASCDVCVFGKGFELFHLSW